MRCISTTIISTFTCALLCNAQVTDYEIDQSFNSGLLFNRGSVSDILLNANNTYVIMGMFGSFTPPEISSSALIGFQGQLIVPANFAGAKVAHYKSDFLQYGHDINRFAIPGGGLYDEFKFEFKKPAYSGPLSNKALDAMVLPDDHILVAGRFFTDSTLMGTPIASQGLRQLCMIDSTGAPVPGFPMLRCAQPVDAELHSIKKLNTGKYIVSGRFGEIEGHATNSIAKLNEDFTVDTTFVSPMLNMKLARVQYIDSQDRIWIYMEGGVLNINPNDTVWGARLYANGELDLSFNIPQVYQETIVPSGGVFEVFFSRVLEDSDGTFIISGGFTKYNGVSCKGIAKIYDNGSLVPGVFGDWGFDEAVWGTHIYNPGGVAYSLPDGKLMLGGQFSSFGGEPYSCLVRLQPSGFVGVNEKEGKVKLTLWPNPASTTIAIHLPGNTLTRASLLDMQGREVFSVPLSTGEQVVDVQHLPKGMYLLRATEAGGGVYVKKLIVQ